MGVNSTVLDQKQQNTFGCILLFCNVELQGHPKQLNGGEWPRLADSDTGEQSSDHAATISDSSLNEVHQKAEKNSHINNSRKAYRTLEVCSKYLDKPLQTNKLCKVTGECTTALMWTM